MRVSVGYHGFMGGPRSMGCVGHRFLTYLARHPRYEAYFLPYLNDCYRDSWDTSITRHLVRPPRRVLDQVVHFCSVLSACPLGCARLCITWMFYELNSLPPSIVREINANDLVLATSASVREVFLQSGVTTTVRTMGHGYDPAIYAYRKRAQRGTFEFLCIAENTPRKNLPVLIQCFEKAFDGRNDVRLTLKLATHEEKDLRRHVRHPDRLRIIQADLREETEVAALYAQADCFVLPTRGEGFGLPMLEAMATGLPVIVTGHGGHLDFCNANNAFLIHNRGFVDSDPECFPFLRSQWADPDPDHLIFLMREVHANYGMAQARAERAYQGIKDEWTWDAQFAREFP